MENCVVCLCYTDTHKYIQYYMRCTLNNKIFVLFHFNIDDINLYHVLLLFYSIKLFIFQAISLCSSFLKICLFRCYEIILTIIIEVS